MEQKRYMEIERIRDDYEAGFRAGDLVQISEKVDGSNGAIQYDPDTGTLAAFSRNKPLDERNRLSGFWDYVQGLQAEDYKDTPDYVIFGEWLTRNVIEYEPENRKKWYVFDIYDRKAMGYLPQAEVKQFAKTHGLNYVHVFYEGPFISWEHVKSFVGKSAYGEYGEGVVLKNQARLNERDSEHPFVVKLVREDLKSWNIQTIAKNLPKRIYLDCVKEEEDAVKEAGGYFGKLCAAAAVRHAKEILEEND